MEQTPRHAFHDVGVTGAPIMRVWYGVVGKGDTC